MCVCVLVLSIHRLLLFQTKPSQSPSFQTHTHTNTENQSQIQAAAVFIRFVLGRCQERIQGKAKWEGFFWKSHKFYPNRELRNWTVSVTLRRVRFDKFMTIFNKLSNSLFTPPPGTFYSRSQPAATSAAAITTTISIQFREAFSCRVTPPPALLKQCSDDFMTLIMMFLMIFMMMVFIVLSLSHHQYNQSKMFVVVVVVKRTVTRRETRMLAELFSWKWCALASSS